MTYKNKHSKQRSTAPKRHNQEIYKDTKYLETDIMINKETFKTSDKSSGNTPRKLKKKRISQGVTDPDCLDVGRYRKMQQEFKVLLGKKASKKGIAWTEA